MDIQLWTAFAAASLIMALIPGPGVLSIVGFAIGSGRRTALASVAGMALGNALAMTLSLAGVGAILAASADAFTILKWAGALYLIGLGLFALARSTTASSASMAEPIAPRVAFLSNIAIGTFHPKTIVFFVAFAPQFLTPSAPYVPQAAILVLTFTAIAATTDTLYALGATRASALLRTPRAMRWTRRAGGGALVAAGVATAAQRG